MTKTTVEAATPKGELPHLKGSKRKPVQIRLTPSEHKELIQTARKEQRSMSFVALRRYRLGKVAE
ncbi:hypothetical protein [Psychrobacter sp.]|uniref:hypothetical protein n=1 Tax=Psychrobacter sp. TaxID=56811 RepID=UPI003BAECEC0